MNETPEPAPPIVQINALISDALSRLGELAENPAKPGLRKALEAAENAAADYSVYGAGDTPPARPKPLPGPPLPPPPEAYPDESGENYPSVEPEMPGR